MLEKKHLKITAKGFENYNGPLSVYTFVNGESVEPIPRHERDRIAATMQCVEISETGKETVAGVSERLISDSAARASVKVPLERQSVEDKVEEETKAAMGDETPKKIYTEDELDEIIEDGGIQALRRVADVWNVKNRSIPTLRQMILDEQEVWSNKEGVEQKKKMAMVAQVAENTRKSSNSGSLAKDDEKSNNSPKGEIKDAAATGNMSAAVSQEKEEE